MNIDWLKLFSRAKSALMRRGSSEQDADDFVQEAFVRMTCFARDHHVENPEAYLMKTAINLAYDAHRISERRGDEVVLEDAVIVDPSPGVEDELLNRERMERMSACLARLSDRTRDMFIAHRMHGMSYVEIARKYGLSVSTVHHHISKALLQITGWMHGWYP